MKPKTNKNTLKAISIVLEMVIAGTKELLENKGLVGVQLMWGLWGKNKKIENVCMPGRNGSVG